MTEVKLGKDAVTLPVGTEAERPSNPVTGMIRWNTDTDALEGYNGVEWAPISSVPISATGGTISDVNIDGLDFRIHAFTSTGTSSFEVVSLGTTDGEAEVLVVAGGGGGVNHSGGGGAGGVVDVQNVKLSPQNYTITVGDGGPGGFRGDFNRNENNGDDSSAFGFVAIGGGGGGHDTAEKGGDGGSGGGAHGGGSPGTGGDALQPTSASGGFGNDGRDATELHSAGGGAGEFPPTVKDAGDGVEFISIFGNSFGENGFFGGGGGAPNQVDTDSSDSGGAGGLGGGGDGGDEGGEGDPGLPNTGGGGGGSPRGGINQPGKPGGSGVVLIRYRI